MRIVTSMTTIPERIGLIKRTIDSLNAQTRKLDAIYINIPYICKNKSYIIPQWLIDMDTVTILRCEDYGPITKLIPVLQKEKDPNTCIVTVDDDIAVHKNWIKIFEQYANKYPESAIGFSGICMGSLLFFWQYNDGKNDHYVDVLEGVWTVLYRRKLFNVDKLLFFIDLPMNRSIKQNLIKNDDHWISSYLGFNKIKKITISEQMNKYIKFLPVKNISSLHGRISVIKEHYSIISLFRKNGIYECFYKWYNSMGFYMIVVIITTIVAITKLVRIIRTSL
jgi:hypothetical protein